MRLEVQSEREKRIARGRQDVLAAVEHVGLDGIRYLAKMGVPERVAIRRIVGDQVAVGVAAKEKFARGCGQAGVAVAFPGRGLQMPPDDLARLVVDGGMYLPLDPTRYS